MEVNYYNWLLVFVRFGAFMLVLPFFSAVNFPVMLRIALGALTALLIAPLLPPFALGRLSLFELFGVLGREVAVGLLLGFVARMVFFAVELAGNFIAAEMGLSMAAMFNPLTRQQEQPPGTILFFLATLVMLTLNLHHGMLLGFARTYELLPVGGAHLSAALFESVVKQTGGIFGVALQISAPVISVSFVITLVFAVLSRAVPQMNVFSESFVFRISGGLMVFGFSLNLTAQHVTNYLHKLPDDLLVVAHMMGG